MKRVIDRNEFQKFATELLGMSDRTGELAKAADSMYTGLEAPQEWMWDVLDDAISDLRQAADHLWAVGDHFQYLADGGEDEREEE